MPSLWVKRLFRGKNDGAPEFQHSLFAPSVAAKRQLIAVFLVAIGRVLVETESEGFGASGITECHAVAIGLKSKKHVFVEKVMPAVG